MEFKGRVAWHNNSSMVLLPFPIPETLFRLYTLSLMTANDGAQISPKSKCSSHDGFKAFF